MEDTRTLKISDEYRCGESSSIPEQELYVRSVEQAIEHLCSRDPEKRKEAIDFIFKGDTFQFVLDMASSFNFDFDVGACRAAIRKRFLIPKRKKDGKNKNDDGRRDKANASSNNDKCTRNSKYAKKPLRIKCVFPGTDY